MPYMGAAVRRVQFVRRREAMMMTNQGTLKGLWVLRAGEAAEAGALLARVQDDLYVLAFTNAPRATSCARVLGAEARPFYVVDANLGSVVREARDAGARAYIVDYDAERATFASAYPLPAVDDARARA